MVSRMMIQSTDKLFYRNPVITGHRWMLFVEDDYVLIARKGRVTWSTTRRPLAQAGIRSTLIQSITDRKVIIGEEYINCSIFKINLLKPIPIPKGHQGKTYFKPIDEEVLSWK